MAKSKKVYIFEWPFVSNKETAGRRAQYSVLLADDGSLSCNCPGWVFYRNKAKPRTCKHLENVEVQKNYKTYLKMHKKGEVLPKFDTDVAALNLGNLTVAKPSSNDSGYARVIMFD